MAVATKTIGIGITLLMVSTAAAFAPSVISNAKSSTTALNHVNTRKRIEKQELGIWPTSCRDKSGAFVPCDAVSGEEVRQSWNSYAPEHGSPTSYGAIGCPGGGDWCYSSSYQAAGPLPNMYDVKKRAAIVAAALAGLGGGTGGCSNSNGLSIDKGVKTAPLSPMSVSMKGSLTGEDVREVRGSFAPFSHDGRVGTLGEIGLSDGGRKLHTTSGKTAGTAGSAAAARSPAKTYALGSWKK